ncbi:hypothetical protein B566_EDAN017812 [Ephemera danica]|nr:hypothetical protein B566_EDAN017812 [Ephemera danica]
MASGYLPPTETAKVRKAEIVNLPCGHRCTCGECAFLEINCSVCSKRCSADVEDDNLSIVT